ncbi:MAG: diguanylate cyclase [Stagnimonas sp.]|nr:diguanylate cyclase [Stagnimonas sp.]
MSASTPETAAPEPGIDPASSEYAVRVLLVDDQPMIGEAVRRALLGQAQLEYHYCGDPAAALDTAVRVRPTVILQDLVMPGIDGLTLVRRYRELPATRDIPIIVLSTKEDPAVKSEAFASGANDYLVKLPDNIELIARIRHHSRAHLNQLQRDAAYRALHESQLQLIAINAELKRLTHVDGLTGLSNRRYCDEYLDQEWRRAAREQLPLAVLMVDVDSFKRYNDHYGHLAGDETLKAVAQALQAGCERPSDLAARFGGEEFIVILPGCPTADAVAMGNKLCRAVAALAISHVASLAAGHVTVSIGAAATRPQPGSSPLQLIQLADQALYRAKEGGRNQVASSASEASD